MELELIEDLTARSGGTPMQRIRRVVPGPAPAIYAKLEYLLPSGTSAERVVRAVLARAEREGHWREGQTVVVPSTGEAGLAAAYLGAVRGFPVRAVLPETTPEGLADAIRVYGGEVVTTPGPERVEGARRRAKEIAAEVEGFLLDPYVQFEAAEVHKRETVEEITAVLGDRIDCLVVGVNSGATLLGVGEVLRAKNPRIRLVAVEPAASPVLSGGEPGAHRLTGLGIGTVPPLLRQRNFFSVEKVTEEEAFTYALRLAREEGMLVSPADGAAMAAAYRVAESMTGTPDADVVVLLQTSGAPFARLLEEGRAVAAATSAAEGGARGERPAELESPLT